MKFGRKISVAVVVLLSLSGCRSTREVQHRSERLERLERSQEVGVVEVERTRVLVVEGGDTVRLTDTIREVQRVGRFLDTVSGSAVTDTVVVTKVATNDNKCNLLKMCKLCAFMILSVLFLCIFAKKVRK